MKKLIINPVGGLANRMRAIASGIALCRDCGGAYFEIAWPVNSDLFCGIGELFEDNEYLLKAKNIGNMADLLFYDIPRKKNFFLTRLLQIGRYGMKLTDWDCLPRFEGEPRKLVSSLEEVYGSVLIRSGVVFYPFDDDFYRQIFKPRASIEKEAERRMASAGRKCIGLHIRRTDNVVAIDESPLSLFIKAIESELESDSGSVFYLASDDPAVKKEIFAIFGKERFVYSDKVVERDSADGIREALTEIAALSKCCKIYGSYWSSFSEAAALMGNVPLVQLRK